MFGTLFFVCVLLHYGGSQPQDGNSGVTAMNKRSVNPLIHQCATKEEVQGVIQV